MYTVLVDESEYGVDSRGLLARLSAAHIQARPLWQPLNLSRAHAGAQPAPCPVAERLNRMALSLPCSVGLSAADQDRIIQAVRTRPR
jgi:perosamine synthetase